MLNTKKKRPKAPSIPRHEEEARLLAEIVLLDGDQEDAPSLEDMARRARALLDTDKGRGNWCERCGKGPHPTVTFDGARYLCLPCRGYRLAAQDRARGGR